MGAVVNGVLTGVCADRPDSVRSLAPSPEDGTGWMVRCAVVADSIGQTVS